MNISWLHGPCKCRLPRRTLACHPVQKKAKHSFGNSKMHESIASIGSIIQQSKLQQLSDWSEALSTISKRNMPVITRQASHLCSSVHFVRHTSLRFILDYVPVMLFSIVATVHHRFRLQVFGLSCRWALLSWSWFCRSSCPVLRILPSERSAMASLIRRSPLSTMWGRPWT